jgi:predicted nucleotidyltransferase
MFLGAKVRTKAQGTVPLNQVGSARPCYTPPMDAKMRKSLSDVFASFVEVKLAYFFGSRVRGSEGPLSDYDFAVYIDVRNPLEVHDIRMGLMERICQVVGSDRVDVIVLNSTVSPELKYQVISTGILLFEREPFKVLVEPRLLNEYFDHHMLLRLNHLTQA